MSVMPPKCTVLSTDLKFAISRLLFELLPLPIILKRVADAAILSRASFSLLSKKALLLNIQFSNCF